MHKDRLIPHEQKRQNERKSIAVIVPLYYSTVSEGKGHTCSVGLVLLIRVGDA